ncbi:MAG: MOSC domain-containing protein [Pseudomonadales bacterium]|nr:MOSC domain-containing protein [Pseudomonadales bacterium]
MSYCSNFLKDDKYLKMKKAACVLVEGLAGRVLALLRSDGKGYCFPGGKVEPNEKYEDAAVRECLEETGYVVEVISDPFIAQCDGYEVWTYKADIVAEPSEQAAPSHEGDIVWIEPTKLLTANFVKYNRACFKHFNIDVIDPSYPCKIYRGKVAKRYGLDTAIDKTQTNKSLYLSYHGLDGDQSADKQHHGGVERALHQYPSEHYAYWHDKYGGNIDDWKAPGMGENISSVGMTEDNVCLGDIYQWGEEALIEVSEPRSPCFKLNKRWGIEGLSIAMQETNRCGWLYRVIHPGLVCKDARLVLIERAPNAMTVREVCDIFYGNPLNAEGLIKLKKQSKLSESWMTKVLQRLDTNNVESWDFRLSGS